MSYLFLLGAVQAFFLVVILVGDREKLLSNWILIVWMTSLGLNLIGSFAASINFFEAYPQYFGFDTTLVLLQGPLAYLYVSYYVHGIKSIKSKDTLHFLPYVLFTIYLLYQVKLYTTDYDSIKRLLLNPDPIMLLLQLSIHLMLIGYIIIILLLVKNHQSKLEKAYSFKEGIDLKWIKNMLWPLMVIALIVLLGIISSDFLSFTSLELKANLFYGGLSLLPFYLLYQGIFHNRFHFKPVSLVQEPKYIGSNLSQDESLLMLKRLDELMKVEKPYLDSYLTISKLAQMMDVHPKYLSQVINEKQQLSFFNYINTFRVEEVKARLANEAYQHFTILSIAMDAGFNTKSAFNQTFKKMTGLTPSAYKKKIQLK